MRASILVLTLTACSSGAMSGPDAPGDADDSLDAANIPDAAPGDPTADELRAAIADCTVVGGMYSEGGTNPANISICGLTVGTGGAVDWTADLDVDCDGKESAQCSEMTDPDYLPETAASDSNGDPLDAATLPYVVIPLASTRFDYTDHGLHMGSVVAVIYEDKVEYGVLGDLGPAKYIGEASYAMAMALGIDPDPSTGGVEGPVVSYIAFGGDDARVKPIEDHAKARAIGIAHAKTLLGR